MVDEPIVNAQCEAEVMNKVITAVNDPSLKQGDFETLKKMVGAGDATNIKKAFMDFKEATAMGEIVHCAPGEVGPATFIAVAEAGLEKIRTR